MELIEKGWHHFLPVNQHVFSLMPLRHSNDVTNLNIVLKHIESREATELDNTQYFPLIIYSLIITGCWIGSRKLLCTNSMMQRIRMNMWTKILRYWRDIHSMLTRLLCGEKNYTGSLSHFNRLKWARCIQKFLKDLWREEMKYVVVSLSGGVDSMVISKILTKLAPVMGFTVPFRHNFHLARIRLLPSTLITEIDQRATWKLIMCNNGAKHMALSLERDLYMNFREPPVIASSTNKKLVELDLRLTVRFWENLIQVLFSSFLLLIFQSLEWCLATTKAMSKKMWLRTSWRGEKAF